MMPRAPTTRPGAGEGESPYSIGARYYASALGSFVTPDWSDSPEAVPYADLSNPQSLNPYNYVLNNPTTATDPDGHWCFLGFGTTCSKAAPKEDNATPPPPMPGAPPVPLTAAQNFARGVSQFQQNRQTGATYCNAATLCIAESTHAPTGPLAGKNGDAVLADAMAKNLANSSAYREVSPAEAQQLADEGKLVIGAWYNPDGSGHVVTVRPEGVPGDAPFGQPPGPLLNDIGKSDQIATPTGAFSRNDLKAGPIHYYTPVGGGGH